MAVMVIAHITMKKKSSGHSSRCLFLPEKQKSFVLVRTVDGILLLHPLHMQTLAPRHLQLIAVIIMESIMVTTMSTTLLHLHTERLQMTTLKAVDLARTLVNMDLQMLHHPATPTITMHHAVPLWRMEHLHLSTSPLHIPMTMATITLTKVKWTLLPMAGVLSLLLLAMHHHPSQPAVDTLPVAVLPLSTRIPMGFPLTVLPLPAISVPRQARNDRIHLKLGI